MKIYIDFDDVICETAKYFTKLAKELFGIDIPYRQVQFFNLQKSFDLNDEQYDKLMKAGHMPENLLDYEETEGASETINKCAHGPWKERRGSPPRRSHGQSGQNLFARYKTR